MVQRVGFNLQYIAASRSDGLNPLGLRSGRSGKSRSLRRAGRDIPPNPTRPARSHLCSSQEKMDQGEKTGWRAVSRPERERTLKLLEMAGIGLDGLIKMIQE